MSWLPHWMQNLPFLGLHFACLAALFVPPDGPSLVLCGVLYMVRMFGITAGYHRYFAHRSYRTSRVFQFCLACLGCTALQRGPLWWTSHHRHHHRHSDTPEDPHSPRTRGFWWSHIGWVLASGRDQANWQVARDWDRYPELRWLERLHWTPGLLLAALCWVVAGWPGVVWGFLISTVLCYHATFAVNSICHLFGKRRYATSDESRNNLLVALVTLGEGWHNNHHYYQSSANQGFFWWEVDFSYYTIRVLGWCRLVWGIRTPPPVRRRPTAPAPSPAS
ncbi:MAG: acyl-CoA desaturase [Gemmataceae bacterium]|nr:acyl-CoA desaturase [Gemmataceae bacterium]